MKCELCHKAKLEKFFRDEKRSWDYWHCQSCDLVFRDSQTYLNPMDEKSRYETHNNNIENLGYVKFLTPAVEELLPYLKQGDVGLDYGSGPGPILDILFKRKGYEVKNYDPYFNGDQDLLNSSYDFATCTEVIEHLYKPRETFDELYNLLKANGLLMLMTDPRPDKEEFPHWGYRMDNTHVCFYSQNTFQWIAQHWNYELIFSQGKLTLLRKKS